MNKTTGFTLIELMITVAVIVVLGMIAIPAYNSFVLKSARSDAMAALMDLRLAQEKWRANHTSYATTAGSLNVDSTSPNGKYSIAVVAGSTGAATFKATATPQGSQASDTECGTFAINQNGPVTSGAYASAACWKR